MREIKFRYFWEDRESKIHILTESIEEIETFKDIPTNLNNGWKLIARCQFTGLHDKNGKERWEGDIIKHDYSSPRRVVEWREKQGQWSIGGFYPESIEVIGNIYENPELLKEKP